MMYFEFILYAEVQSFRSVLLLLCGGGEPVFYDSG